MFPQYLTLHEIEHIKTHKYKSGGYSYIDKKIDPFWNACALALPKKLSPNWVTIGCAIFLLSGVQVAWLLDPTMRSPLPAWAHIYFAFAIWAAQTLDAIDGKHARNTGQSSPVGQLLDHGADAFCNCFQTCMISSAFGFGDSFMTLIVLIYVQSLFWIMNWEEHLTGILRTHVDGLGGTEFQFIGMFILICPVIDVFGVHKYKLPYSNLSIMDTLIYLTIFMGLFNMVYKIFKNVILSLEGEKQKKGLKLVISPVLILISELFFYKSQILAYHTIEMCVLGGIVFGFYMSKLIVCTMSQKTMSIYDFDAISFFVVQMISTFVLSSYHQQVALYSVFGAVMIIRYLRFVIAIIRQLLQVLNIHF